MAYRLRATSPLWGVWVGLALLVSLAFHFLLLVWAKKTEVTRMSQAYYDQIVPRTFQIERAEIDPKLLEPTEFEQPQQVAVPEKIQLPDERVSLDHLPAEVRAKPDAPPIDQSILARETAQAAPDLREVLASAKSVGAESLLEDDQALREALLSDSPSRGGEELVLAPEELAGRPDVPPGAMHGLDGVGFSNLDDLLAQTGPLSSETAPILMPADLLFQYDSASLQSRALASLEKLGELIRKNPQSYFIIEGHTDSFGPDQYNLDLSALRAQNVKMWLVQQMQIPPERISTVGYGKSRLIAPADADIEGQQLNRRVEIVIRNQP